MFALMALFVAAFFTFMVGLLVEWNTDKVPEWLIQTLYVELLVALVLIAIVVYQTVTRG